MRGNLLGRISGNRSGFTLMELMIVAIILAVVAGLAVPGYMATVEKSRRQEALGVLGALRQAELRYFSGYNTFTNDLTKIDFNPTATGVGTGTVHFTYAVTAAANTFTGTATRNSTNFNAASGCGNGWTVTIDQAGVVGGAGC